MPFHPRLDEEAAKALMALPHFVRIHVASEIRRLIQDPVALSRPAAFPHPLEGQLFDTKFFGGETEYFITIMFRYHADEIHLDIAWITYLTRPFTGLEPYEDPE